MRGFRAQFHRPKRNRQNASRAGAANHVEQIGHAVPAREPAQVLEDGDFHQASHAAAVEAKHSGARARRHQSLGRRTPFRLHRAERAADEGAALAAAAKVVFT